MYDMAFVEKYIMRGNLWNERKKKTNKQAEYMTVQGK